MGILIQRNEIPVFASEAEEAAWWDLHRGETAAWMSDAIQRRRTTSLEAVLSKARSPLDFDGEDLDRARALAQKQGVSYQSFVRQLFHEAVEREERKLAS